MLATVGRGPTRPCTRPAGRPWRQQLLGLVHVGRSDGRRRRGHHQVDADCCVAARDPVWQCRSASRRTLNRQSPQQYDERQRLDNRSSLLASFADAQDVVHTEEWTIETPAPRVLVYNARRRRLFWAIIQRRHASLTARYRPLYRPRDSLKPRWACTAEYSHHRTIAKYGRLHRDVYKCCWIMHDGCSRWKGARVDIVVRPSDGENE